MLNDKCGVIGVWNGPDAAHLTYAGLYAIQHRGQESAGIAVSDGEQIRLHKGMGKVVDIFDADTVKHKLIGNYAIGHTRYSTSGGSTTRNVQPLHAHLAIGEVAIAHNGQITNAPALQKELEERGAIFQTSSDTEIIFHLMATHAQHSFMDRLKHAVQRVEGAFSLVLLHRDQLIGVRDPNGFRPLCLGRKDDAYVLASETCALDLMGAKYVREVAPGEIVVISRNGVVSHQLPASPKSHFCVFELIYFSRPDSLFQGRSVLSIRRALGRKLAEEGPVNADVVVNAPDSSNAAALGYAEASGIPYELGMIRNHYIGRTFIEPAQAIRDWRARIKYNPVRSVIEGRSIVLVDDSIVRGTTSKRLIRMLREAGAREIHLRISSPIFAHPCYYGIDTPDYDQLIGHRMGSVERIQDYLETDSLHYLTHQGLRDVVREAAGMESYCDACFTGNYPVPVK
jgi:amidophosphoribosyltransferase